MQKRVRAIIIEDGLLLTIKRVKDSGTYWTFPGGGIENGEDDVTALVRECREELGVDAEVLEKLFENSFIREKEGEQQEHFYSCRILSGQLGTGDGPEYQENSHYEGTHELEWISMNELKDYDLRPEKIKNSLIVSELENVN